MVVTESGRFISQRDKGAQRLALVRAVLSEEGLGLFAPEMDPLLIPLEVAAGKRGMVQVHDKVCEGIDAGDEAARWINAYLPPWKNERFRLVCFPRDYVRETKDIYTQLDTAVTQFADGYAVLITSEGSLEDLNHRLEERGVGPVRMSVFRSNLVLTGVEPWQEDGLKRLQIGEVVLEVVKPCGRCPITGVNQEEGKFSSKPQEPRETLKSFHSGRHLLEKFPDLESALLDKPMFGQNAVVVKTGTVRIGDEVKVISRRGSL
jgi:uncharacterized protein YcbX